MPSPLRSLRSWLKEERRLLPERPLLRGVSVVSLLLLAGLLLLEARRRNGVVEGSLQAQRQERMELVAAALDDIRRTSFDWARWNDSHRYVQGLNPAFVQRDLAQTSLFSSGGVMVLFDLSGRPLVSYGSRGADRAEHAPLLRCAKDNLHLLRDLSSAVQLLCRNERGAAFLGVLTRISNNDSSAPAAW